MPYAFKRRTSPGFRVYSCNTIKTSSKSQSAIHVEVRSSPLGGHGLFALRPFAEGDVILKEPPLLKLPGVPWYGLEDEMSGMSASAKLIEEAVQELDSVRQEEFWRFTQAPVYGDTKTASGVFWTNMIGVFYDDDDDDELCLSCMFLLTCRLNHSCVPNVSWEYETDENEASAVSASS
eukprot:763215-Hanusia_phi.AAC.3